MFSSVSALATFVAAGFGGLTPESGDHQGKPEAPPLLKAGAALALGRILDLYSTDTGNFISNFKSSCFFVKLLPVTGMAREGTLSFVLVVTFVDRAGFMG